MKIYILPVHENLQPDSTAVVYPDHNEDYWMEQDFLKYLEANSQLVTEKSQGADFHYLPVFWARWNNNHDNGETGQEQLQSFVNQAIIDDVKTFTICQPSKGTLVEVGRTIVFSPSRRTETYLDLPLICKSHQLPSPLPGKKYLAFFIGRLCTHPIRMEMADCFKKIENVCILDDNKGEKFYVEKILESYITLCPRGFGGGSYRFFETMQLGGVPFLIGDLDTRPFKKYINWDNYSFYAEIPQRAVGIVQNCRKDELLAMGKECAKIWREKLTYGKWCEYVIKELSDL